MIKEFKEGHWYKWTGPKVRDSRWGWNPLGQMDFILDGLPHLCTRVDSSFPKRAAFYDSSDYLWGWCNILYYLEEVQIPKELETHIHDGRIYTLLRPITIKSLILDGARDEDVDYFRYRSPSIASKIVLEDAVTCCLDCSDKVKWMEDKGYWEVKLMKRTVKATIESMFRVEYTCPFCGTTTYEIRHVLQAIIEARCSKCDKEFEVTITTDDVRIVSQ